MLARIVGIYAGTVADRFMKRQPVTRDDIPVSFHSLNADWLTAVLCSNISGARVIGFDLLDGHSGSTNRQRIDVRYNDAGNAARLPTALFAKGAMSFTSRMSAGATGSMLCECEFYNRIRPKLSIEAPVGCFANYDAQSCAAIILLVDLVSTGGGSFCDPTKTYIDRPHVEAMVDLLANVHGQYFGAGSRSSDLAVLPPWANLFTQISRIAKISTYGNKGLFAAAHVVPENILRKSKKIWPATLRAAEIGRRDPQTLTHGDVHVKNWYVKDDGRMGLADWQTASRGPYARDLAYAIAAALTVENRREWEKDLIARYLDRVGDLSGVELSFEETFLAYRQQMLTALAFWTPTLRPPPYMPLMQPVEVSCENIKRITHAMDDLDSLSALDEH